LELPSKKRDYAKVALSLIWQIKSRMGTMIQIATIALSAEEDEHSIGNSIALNARTN
jgi:hypothetical protein